MMLRNEVCLFVGVFGLVAALAACSDSKSSKPVDGAEAWVDLGGPPGELHAYLGELGQRTCYVVNYGVEAPVVGCFSPTEGWREDRALAAIVKGSEVGGQSRERIKRVSDADFLLNFQTGVLHRSEDHGATWQPQGPVPEGATIASFEADGRHLFLVGEQAGSRQGTLWRSRDEGASWEVLRDDAISGHVVVLPGLIITPDGMSTDGGESWRARPASCVNTPQQAHWYQFDDRYLFIAQSSVGEFDSVAGCVRHALVGLSVGATNTAEHYLAGLALHRGQLFGVTRGGEVGRIDASLSRWEPVALPEGLELMVDPYGGFNPALTDLGPPGLVGWMTSGLWISRDAGESWSSIAHPYSAPRWLVEHEGKLLAPGAGDAYARDIDGDTWQRVPELSSFARNHVVEREGQLFGLAQALPQVFVPDETLPLGRLVWQDELFSQTWSYYRPRVTLHAHGDRTFIASSRLYTTASAPYLVIALPGSEAALEAAAQSYVGGGVHVAGSIDGPFTRFGEGLTDPATGSHMSVASVAFDDAHIWAVTSLYGVWHARLDDGRWAEAHEGLPRAGDGEPAQHPVHRLVALDGALYALSADALFVREADAWHRLTDGFAASNTPEGRISPLGLLDVVAHNGELLAVAWDGVDRLDPTTGARERIWDSPREILGADALPSGLYVRLAGGGVWRYRQ